jgi:hypothetical protein
LALSAPADAIDRTTAIHRRSRPYHGSRNRPRPQHDAGPYDAADGYSTYWQYTTALAFSVLAVRKPAIIRPANAIGSFMSISSLRNFQAIL